jgi:hypothetical protein
MRALATQRNPRSSALNRCSALNGAHLPEPRRISPRWRSHVPRPSRTDPGSALRRMPSRISSAVLAMDLLVKPDDRTIHSVTTSRSRPLIVD